MKSISLFEPSGQVMQIGPRWLLTFLLILTLLACNLSANSNTDIENSDTPWDWSEEYVHREVNHIRAGRDLNPEKWPGGARDCNLKGLLRCMHGRKFSYQGKLVLGRMARRQFYLKLRA